MALEEAVLDHDLLDDLPQTAHLHHLRRLLVLAAVIPPRDHEYLHRLGPWLRAHLAGRPDHHVRLVNQFAEWDFLHDARR